MQNKTLALGIMLCASFALSACGGEGPESEERGKAVFPSEMGKADGTLSCVASCGVQAVGGCWCDAGCAQYGDCCPDFEDMCVVDEGPETPDPEPWPDPEPSPWPDWPDPEPQPEPTSPAPEPCYGVCTWNAHCSDFCPQGASCVQVIDDGPAYWLILGC